VKKAGGKKWNPIPPVLQACLCKKKVKGRERGPRKNPLKKRQSTNCGTFRGNCRAKGKGKQGKSRKDF